MRSLTQEQLEWYQGGCEDEDEPCDNFGEDEFVFEGLNVQFQLMLKNFIIELEECWKFHFKKSSKFDFNFSKAVGS